MGNIDENIIDKYIETIKGSFEGFSNEANKLMKAKELYYTDIVYKKDSEIFKLKERIVDLEREIIYLKDRVDSDVGDVDEYLRSKMLREDMEYIEEISDKEGEALGKLIDGIMSSVRRNSSIKESKILLAGFEKIFYYKDSSFKMIKEVKLSPIILISIVLGKIEFFMEKYETINNIVNEDLMLSRIVALYNREKNLKKSEVYSETLRSFIESHKEYFGFIEVGILNSILHELKICGIESYSNIIYGDERNSRCRDGHLINRKKAAYIVVKDRENHIRYIYDNWGGVCEECKAIYLNMDKFIELRRDYRFNFKKIEKVTGYFEIVNAYIEEDKQKTERFIDRLLANIRAYNLSAVERKTIAFIGIIIGYNIKKLYEGLGKGTLLIGEDSGILVEILNRGITNEIIEKFKSGAIILKEVDKRLREKIIEDISNYIEKQD